MAKQTSSIVSLPQRVLAILAACAVAVGVWARFYRLGLIDKPIFDEVYFPVFANQFLHHQLAFDVHPPLGKLFIALGIAAFGNDGFGWRIVPALFGLGIIALLAWLWRSYRGTWSGVFLVASFLSLDGALIAYSRTGLIDGIMIFFIFLAFALAVRMKEDGKGMLWLATALGLAVGVKWIALGVIIPVAYLMIRKRLAVSFLSVLPWALWVYIVVVMGGELIGRVAHPWAAAWEWHKQALDYHLSLKATHPWSSKWWSWPIQLRPVLFWYESVGADKIWIITTLGNPVLWWASTAAVITGLIETIVIAFQRKWKELADHPLLPLLIGYFSFWLPFAGVQRVMFQYHYLPSYVFALLILTYYLDGMWKRQPWAVIACALALAAVGLYFLPLSVGLPISMASLANHIWIKSWLY